MRVRERIDGAIKGALVSLTCIPVAVLLTFLATPLWRWLEHVTGIESVGHSGPAEWCFVAAYLGALVGAGYLWSHLHRR